MQIVLNNDSETTGTSFSDMDNFLLVDYNFPLLSKEDVKRARMLLKPSRLIWTGKVFRYEK